MSLGQRPKVMKIKHLRC